ncbi:MAG: LysR family transcriptional regulator [candidate division NC10 bacterium]|nr:LysR family transcriptional regulator [candidate division NC10 bacterium]MBI2114878.1 LysR family transcriptional regulator [candidate division NC10 bacterium]MBI2162908.1 LysR family transcriptional regulator [candidate division NC10 bacterium]MBI2455613.1 LysR family transcriptional regulator [candidate division NC10 bacterium]MBI3084758.1 LysR family transcriptional regulator [candidate division NC10 bacterium]
MNLEILKLYCDIVRLRSFSQGAAANQISQSAASQAIQQLEAELDVLLIDRSKRPFMVTPEGRTFAEGCRALLQGFEKVRAEIASSRTQVTGSVRVAAIYSVGIHIMSDHMQRFMSLYPQVKVRLEYLHPHKVVDAVLNDEADLGILSYPPANRSLTILPWRSETMVFVCHPTHRLARRKIITAADLNGENFIAFDADLRIRKAIDRCLRQHDARVKVIMEFDNIETIKQAIAIGAGVGILPRPTILKEAGNRTLAAVPLAMPELVRPLGIIHRRGKLFTPTIGRFLELLRQSDEKPTPP